MKIKLTEAQLGRVKLITEGQERVDVFFKKVEDINERANRLFSKITYTTLSELLEGEADLSIYQQQLDHWRTVLHTHYKRVGDFFQHMSDEEFDSKWMDTDIKVDSAYQNLSYKKLDMLDDMIEGLKKISESNIEEYFKDIKQIDM